MADISDSPDTYISAAKIEVGHCRNEVPDALYDFIVWSTSARDYQNVTTTSEADVPDLRVLAICHNIIALCQKVKTALTLGLALQVHHDVGSMHLVDVLHNLGHCVSYDEVRHGSQHPLPKTRSHRLEMYMYHEVYRMLTLLWTLPSTTLIRMKKRLMGKPPPIPWLPSSTKDVEPSIMMKAFREQGRRHWMSQNILKSSCTDIPSHNRGQNHRLCSMPPCWK